MTDTETKWSDRVREWRSSGRRHGNDARLPPWQSGELAARLQASSTSSRPVLLRVDYAAGHGAVGSTTATQRAQFVADEFAFALWQTGDPAFAPAK